AAPQCLTGLAGVILSHYTRITVGTLPSVILAALFLCWGVHVIRKRSFFSSWPQVGGAVMMIASLSVLVATLSDAEQLPASGGLLGLRLVEPGTEWMGVAGVFGVALLALIVGATLTFGRSMHALILTATTAVDRVTHGLARIGRFGLGKVGGVAQSVQVRHAGWQETRAERRALAAAAAAEAEAFDAEQREESSMLTGESSIACLNLDEEVGEVVPVATTAASAVLEPPVEEERAPSVRKPPRKKKAPKKREVSVKDDRILVRSNKDYQLPTIDLLEEAGEMVGEARNTLEKRASVLEKTLGEFKIDGRVVGVESGPRVTMFEVSLAPGIRVERIFSLANNITMALKAYNVRIVAPIPGKDTVGIEIPNMENNMVGMKEIFKAYDMKKNEMAAPMFLGADITGTPIVADLAKMPHLLIAGATGSGKSVCINTILMSYLMTKRPDELKLILIDPKMVELSRFKDVPHLMSPVVTDMKRAAGILEWACTQMDQRYEQMALLRINNIAKFNALGEKEVLRRLEGELPPEEIETFPKRMPYVTIVVDELADLMMVAGKEVEKSIIRLASKSRAVGIHVILATQRPSVDVITGLIKANMPSRIAFQVASRVDSRTILDSNGAESLLGAGDMLFLPPGTSKLVRSQGVYVGDDELFRIIDHCKAEAQPEYHEELKGPVIGGSAGKEDADR
ncbi:MAG: DNA translocase FtsK, partial [Planctomycetota bacterium]